MCVQALAASMSATSFTTKVRRTCDGADDVILKLTKWWAWSASQNTCWLAMWLLLLFSPNNCTFVYLQFRTYRIHKPHGESFYPFVFSDTRGLETNNGLLINDINLALKGHVKDGYEVKLLQTVVSKQLILSVCTSHWIVTWCVSRSLLVMCYQRVIHSTTQLRLTTTRCMFWFVLFQLTEYLRRLKTFCSKFGTFGRQPANWVRAAPQTLWPVGHFLF